MTRDEAVIEMQNILGYTSIQVEPCQRALKNAQQRLESGPIRPWFLQSEVSTATTAIGERRVLMPADFLEEDDDAALWYIPSGGLPNVELVKEELDFLERNALGMREDVNGVVIPAAPRFYAISGPYFLLFPTPDAIYTLKLIYFKQDALLTSNIENNWLKYAPWLLIGEAGTILSVSSRDKAAQAEFARLRQSAGITLNTQNESRQHSNRSYVMGDGAL